MKPPLFLFDLGVLSMGSIRARGKYNHLVIDFRYQGVRCREQTLLADNAPNRKKLENILLKIEREINLGSFNYSKYFPHSKRAIQFRKAPESSNTGTPLFSEFAEVWFLENSVRLKRSVQQSYRFTLDRLLIPYFGHFEVGAIKKADILAFRTEYATYVRPNGKLRAASTVNNVMKPLRGVLIEAAERFDFDNPVRNVKKLIGPKKDIHPFSFDEVILLCKEVRKDYESYLITLFFTGMRTGEINGLKWKYVDFENNIISVRETVVLGQEDTPKTLTSNRDIQMVPLVKKALLKQREHTSKNMLVFTNTIGTYIYANNFRRRVWTPLLKRLGLEVRRPYETRHTAATMWLASGENPEWVARQLGHSNTEMLFRVYSRYIPNLTRNDGSAFQSLIDKKIGGKDEI